ALYTKKTLFGYGKISAIIAVTTLVAVSGVWFHYLTLIDHEYQQDIQTTNAVSANLLLAYDENIRRNFENIDDVLGSLKQEYEKNGLIRPESITHIYSTKSLPVLHISVMGEKGDIFVSSNPEQVKENRNYREYFLKHRERDLRLLLVSRAVPEQVFQENMVWTFHLSYRLNKPDGSFGGVVVAAVDPLYFARLFRQMDLGNGAAIAMQDMEGNVLARQMGDEFSAGMNIAGADLYKHLRQSERGFYSTASSIDNVRRFISYFRMPEYPIVLAISERETEVLKPFYQRRSEYYASAIMESLLLIGACWLLILMEKRLREVNENLDRKVEERTKELDGANEKLTEQNSELEAMNGELEALNEELHRLTLVDGLTGIANRRYFDEYLEREWRTGLRQQKSLSLIMADIDFFKLYNDTYGHQSGDDCLRDLASVLDKSIKRVTDLAARYGGEEFTVILPDTDLAGALIVAEKIRKRVEDMQIANIEAPGRWVTISLGVASMVPSTGESSSSLIALADKAMYQAKKSGRNRVVSA
ncbi:MAG TPA: diguanylate cyclase, partial [Negativicutes bacterium]|nr:diguanylate cyclase [Negativicutes bacterium]